MNTFLSIVGAILVVVLGALFSVPHFIDWNLYRGVIEEEASRAVGRDVRIGANVHVRLLPTPSIRLEDVRIADTTALTGEPIFRTAEVSARLAISPLLRGAVEVSEIELVRPVVRVVVDDNGGGNWQSLTTSAPGLSYLPSNIALNTVLISDGRLVVFGDGGRRERVAVTAIAGDVTSQGATGPYRFKGAATVSGAVYDVRGQLADADTQGGRRLGLTAKAASGGTMRFDGRAENVGGVPSLKGEAVATIPFDVAGAKTGGQSAEIKYDVAADTRGADLTNLQVSFESGGRPQMLTGSGRVGWQNETDLSASIGAQWLDIDQLSGFKPNTGDTPLAALGRTFGRLPDWARVGGGKRLIRIAVAQAALGGDTVANLSAVLSGTGTATRIDDVRATLPGNGRIEAAGDLVEAGSDRTRFTGMAMLKAGSAARLFAWASGGRITASQDYDSPVEMNGTVDLSPTAVAVSQLSGRAGASVFEGSLDYTSGDKPSARLVLSGPAIDVRAFESGTAKEETLLAIVDRLADAAGKQGRTDLSLSLTTGTLTTARRTYRNVAASLTLTGDALDIRRLDATTDDGAGITLEGKLARPQSNATRPGASARSGTLRGAVTIPRAEALKSVAELAGLPATWATTVAKVPAALPLAMAITADFGAGDTRPALRMSADGMTGSVHARIDGALDVLGDGWATNPADLTVTLDGRDGAAADRLLTDAIRVVWGAEVPPRLRPAEASSSPPDASSGTVRVRATGVPRQTLALMLNRESAAGSVTFDGRASAVDTVPKLTGTLNVAATDGAGALSIVPLVPVDVLAGMPLTGRASASLDGGELRLDDIAVTAGQVPVRGTLTLKASVAPRGQPAAPTPTQPAAAPVVVDGALHIGRLDIRRLVELVTDTSRPAAAAAAGISVALGRSGVWPDRPFDFSSVDAHEGRVALTADTLVLPDGIEASAATATLQLARGRIELTDIAASGLGGKWTASARLERQPGGAAFAATLRLDQGDLARLGGTGLVAGQGTLGATGISPAALVTALAGNGSIDVGPTAKVSGLSARTLRQIVERALSSTPDVMGQVLRSGLSDAPMQDVPLGARKIAFEVASGLARLKPVAVESTDGRVLFGGRLDLASFMVSTDWQADAKMPPRPAEAIPVPKGLPPLPLPAQKTTAPLPPVIVASSEPLATLGKPDAKRNQQMNLGDLERELAVRKVERDLEALERLRQIDEELQKLRARERAEELARREAEARAQAAAAAAAAQSPPATQQPSLPIAVPAPTAADAPAAGTSPSAPAAQQDPAAAPLPPPQESAPRPTPRPAAPKASSTGGRPFTDEERRRIFNSGGG